MLLVAFKAVSAPASDNGVSPTAFTSASSVGHSMTPKSAEDNSESSKLAKHSAQRATVALRAMRKTDMCKYFPSPIEKEWTDASAKGKICEIAGRPNQVIAANLWLQYAAEANLRNPTVEEREVLSRFECSNELGTWTEWIEPLTGIARHPFAKVHCPWSPVSVRSETNDIFDLSYLIPANACEFADGGANASAASKTLTATAKAKFFDLGCATFDREKAEEAAEEAAPSDPNAAPFNPDATFTAGSAAGSSLPLFDTAYNRNCLPLTDMYGWEAIEYKPSDYWASVPPADRARLHFFNVPITEDDGVASFSEMLKASATASDFIGVKVDIDYVPVEHKIVNDIKDKPELTALVDELYFEYHFWFDDLDFGWGSQTGGANYVEDSVDDAMALMSGLRQKGIRTHFWI
eukprot:Transcript_6568.p2 GENE.Transcript_6568~~Transcript_6568.p2  ORF type:complete len:407 (-),score=126.45 Transcript_6568:1540-2760(-)